MKEQAKRVLKIEAEAVAALINRIDERFEKAVEMLLKCKGRVVVTGMGKSGLIGKKIAATLASTGTPALFLHPAEGIHGDLGMVTRGDTVIALSNSGETEELALMLPSLKRLGIKIIALTGNTESTLAKNSDVVIDIGVKEEACPLGLAPTASTTATLAMGDALAVVLLDQRGFKQEDFACFHVCFGRFIVEPPLCHLHCVLSCEFGGFWFAAFLVEFLFRFRSTVFLPDPCLPVEFFLEFLGFVDGAVVASVLRVIGILQLLQ